MRAGSTGEFFEANIATPGWVVVLETCAGWGVIAFGAPNPFGHSH